MRRFKHKENGRVVRLLEVFEKSGSMLVEYEDDKSTKNYSPSTMRRWWDELPEEEVTGTEEVAEATEEVASDGTSYKQVMTEILADEKLAVQKKTEKTAKKKAEKTTVTTKQEAQFIPEILTHIENAANKIGATAYIRDRQPNFINYKGEKSVLFTVHRTSSSVQLFAKSRTLPATYWKSFESVNGFFDKKLSITDNTKDTKKLIDNIIDSLKEEQK